MYTAQELADRFGFTVKTIYTLASRGVIPHARSCVPGGTNYGPEHRKALEAYRELFPLPGNRVTQACFAQRRRAGQI